MTPLKFYYHYPLVSCHYNTPLVYVLVLNSMLFPIFHQSRLLTLPIPTSMGICTFCYYFNKYAYYIIRKHSYFYIIKIWVSKHIKTYINFHNTFTHKVKLTFYPPTYLYILITSHNTTFKTHTHITQTFSKHKHTYNHNHPTHYTHLLVLLLILHSVTLNTSRFHTLVIPPLIRKYTLYCYINKIDYYIIQKQCISYIKNNMPPNTNTNSIPSNTTLKAKPIPYHTNFVQLNTQNNTTPPIHTYTPSKPFTLYTHTYNTHLPQTNKPYLLQCPKTTTHTHKIPKTNLPPPQPTPHIMITTPKLNNINNYLTYIHHNTQGKLTKLQNKKIKLPRIR